MKDLGKYLCDMVSISENEKYTLVHENMNDHVIIRSKPESFQIVPFALIRKFDEIKYMILWLNLYCSEHPDCDKVKLNEELRKVIVVNLGLCKVKCKSHLSNTEAGDNLIRCDKLRTPSGGGRHRSRTAGK
ncbi:hypothetical protein ACJJTC_011749 [Scirpophaga incertulas]